MKNASAIARSAQEMLDYIAAIKLEAALLLYSKTPLLYSAIHISDAELNHAITCIDEIIDDMLRHAIADAKQLLDASVK